MGRRRDGPDPKPARAIEALATRADAAQAAEAAGVDRETLREWLDDDPLVRRRPESGPAGASRPAAGRSRGPGSRPSPSPGPWTAAMGLTPPSNNWIGSDLDDPTSHN